MEELSHMGSLHLKKKWKMGPYFLCTCWVLRAAIMYNMTIGFWLRESHALIKIFKLVIIILYVAASGGAKNSVSVKAKLI